MSNGIYWVYFKSPHNGGDEMVLQIEAKGKDQATLAASKKAEKMGYGWQHSKTVGVR